MARRKRKSVFYFKSKRTQQLKSPLKHVAKSLKSSLRADDEGEGGFTVMAEMWPSSEKNRLAEPYTRQDGTVVNVEVCPVEFGVSVDLGRCSLWAVR